MLWLSITVAILWWKKLPQGVSCLGPATCSALSVLRCSMFDFSLLFIRRKILNCISKCMGNNAFQATSQGAAARFNSSASSKLDWTYYCLLPLITTCLLQLNGSRSSDGSRESSQETVKSRTGFLETVEICSPMALTCNVPLNPARFAGAYSPWSCWYTHFTWKYLF